MLATDYITPKYPGVKIVPIILVTTPCNTIYFNVISTGHYLLTTASHS